MTPAQAALLMDAHEVWAMLNSEEECELLEQNNPAMLTAYEALRELALQEQDP